MKIAVNTRLLIKDKLEGIGWFTYEALKRITLQHPEHQFFFIFDRPFHPDFIFSDNITPIVQFPQARHPLLFCIWFDYSLPGLLSGTVNCSVDPDCPKDLAPIIRLSITRPAIFIFFIIV